MEKTIHQLRGVSSCVIILRFFFFSIFKIVNKLQELKQQLYDTVEQVPPADKTDAVTLARYFVDADETFFSNCEKELSKVNIFYSGTRF